MLDDISSGRAANIHSPVRFPENVVFPMVAQGTHTRSHGYDRRGGRYCFLASTENHGLRNVFVVRPPPPSAATCKITVTF